MEILNESGREYESVNYYETPLTADELRELIQKLGLSPRNVLREDELAARHLKLDSMSDDALIQAMIDHPKLIERPIVISNGRAAIGRPPELVLDILR